MYENKIDTNIIKINYTFLKENPNLYEKINETIKKTNIINYKTFKAVEEFKQIISNIYKNDEMFYTYISIYILESFNTGLIEIMEFKKYKNMHDSINRITRNLENLNIFIRRKRNMNEKKIDGLYDFILKIINVLNIEKVIDIIL